MYSSQEDQEIFVSNAERQDMEIAGKNHFVCEVMFAPGSSNKVDTYISFVSTLNCIFIRNFTSHKHRQIDLNFYPTSLSCVNYNVTLEKTGNKDMQKGGLHAMFAFGEKNGQCHIMKLEGEQVEKLFKTKLGIAYGAVTSVCFNDTGLSLIVGTESGEIATYELHHTFSNYFKHLPQ